MRSRGTILPLVIFLVAVGLFRATQNAVQTTYVPFGQDSLHLNASEAGFAVTLIGVVTSIVNLLLASRLKPSHLRWMTSIGLVTLSLGICLVVIGDSIAAFMISAALFGITGGVMRTGLVSLAGRIPGITRDRGLAAYTVALSASLVVGPSVESGLLGLSHNSLSLTLLAFVPLPLLALVLLLRTPTRIDRSSGGPRLVTSRARIMENASLRLAITGQMLYQIPFIAITTFGVLLAHDIYGASLTTAELSFTTFFLLSFSTRLVLVWRTPVLHTKLIIQACGILTLTGVLIVGNGNGIPFLMLAMGLLGIPHGLMFPLAVSLIARGTNAEEVPKANATLFAATSIISVVSPTLLGLVVSRFGYHGMLIAVSLPVVVLTAVLFAIDGNINKG